MTSKIAIINESFPTYNLATHKMVTQFRREGNEVFFSPRADMWSKQCTKAYLSAVFTYDLPKLVEDARLLREQEIEIEIGGPAATAMPKYIEKATGITPHQGLDERFEHIMGDFQATFTSRGCPRKCEFCLVPKLEGQIITEYDEFPIPVGVNPYVCDNNILATSWRHQLLVVDRLKNVRNLDLNSGFDDRIFVKDPEKYWALYRRLHMECWRFAYDTPAQKDAIEACARFLTSKGVDYRHIIVFCLVGGPGVSFKDSREKLQFLVDIGCSPYPMRYRPVDSVEKDHIPPGWDAGQLEQLFAFYGVPFVWRRSTWESFSPEARKEYQENKAGKEEQGALL